SVLYDHCVVTKWDTWAPKKITRPRRRHTNHQVQLRTFPPSVFLSTSHPTASSYKMSAFAAPEDPDALDYSYTDPDYTTTTPPVGPPEQSMSSPEPSHSRSRSNNPLLGDDNSLVSELEQEVLDEYARLLRNVNQLSEKIGDLAGSPASMTLDGLRMLERKTATVCTLLKASVYSIVLQQQIMNESEEQQQHQSEQERQFQDQEYQQGGYDGDGDVTFQ
ncbi:hypothetical protein F1880_002678, partial [Penicillium rolfsii]